MSETANNEMSCSVFVYGTLMRGERAHSYLDKAEYSGEYLLRDHEMYDLGRYPAIVPAEGGVVYGEVYRIARDMLVDMDSYEGEGYLYNRKTVTVENDGGRLEAFVYVYAKEIYGKRIAGGRWKER